MQYTVQKIRGKTKKKVDAVHSSSRTFLKLNMGELNAKPYEDLTKFPAGIKQDTVPEIKKL
jgi:hypothetical protein